jgi:hypothetical protein
VVEPALLGTWVDVMGWGDTDEREGRHAHPS